MRLSLLPPPSTEELSSFRIHEVVRDYPELRPILRAFGMDEEGTGRAVLGDLLSPVAPELARLLEELRWRADPVVPCAPSTDPRKESEGA